MQEWVDVQCISEILKQFKNLAVVYYRVEKLSASPRVIKPDNNTPARFLNST